MFGKRVMLVGSRPAATDLLQQPIAARQKIYPLPIEFEIAQWVRIIPHKAIPGTGCAVRNAS